MDYRSALYETLGNVLSPDTDAIKAATDKLNKQLYKDPQCIPALFEIGVEAQDPGLKQLAFVELRKRVSAKSGKIWMKQSDDVRNVIKSKLLELETQEQNKSVRSALTRVIGNVISPEFAQGTWPEFIPWLWSVTESPNDFVREVGQQVLYTVITSLLDSLPSSADGVMKHVFEKLTQALNDPVLAVRVWAVRSIGKLVDVGIAEEPENIEGFQQLVPGIVQVLQAALQENDETSVKAIVEVLDSYTFGENNMLGQHTEALVAFLLSAAGNPSYDDDQRIMLLNALFWILRVRKSKILQLGLVPKIIESILPIGAEDEPEDDDDDAPSRAVYRLLDTLASYLPPQHVFPTVFDQVNQIARDASPGLRKSAITSLGVTIDGCAMFIQPHFEQIWPLVMTALQDPEVTVRRAACTTLGLLSQSLSEEAASKHAELLPILFQLLSDPNTQKSAAVALDCLLETLGDAIIPYLDQLVPSLSMMLQAAPMEIKSLVVGCISSAAHAGKERFIPFFEQTIQQLLPYMSLTEEGEQIELRAVTQDSIGTIADAVGAQVFAPYLEPTMRLVLEGTAIPKAPTLKESAYIFFSIMSRVFKADFAPYLPVVMPLFLATLSEPDITLDDSKFADTDAMLNKMVASAEENDGDIDQDVFEDILDDEDDELDDAIFAASTVIATEKEYASDALAELFAATKSDFMPYLLPSLDKLREGLQSKWHASLRKSSASALLGYVSTLYQMSGLHWTPGLSSPALEGDLATVANGVTNAIFETWDEEDDREVVRDLCSSLSTALITVGPRLLDEAQYQALCSKIIDILNGRSLCQTIDQDDAGFGDEEPSAATNAEQSEYDAALNGAAMELAGSISTVLGPDFARIADIFIPTIASFYRPDKSSSDRAASIGSFAEIANTMGSAITPYVEQLFPLFLSALTDSDVDVRSNAAFGMGCLILNADVDMSSQYTTILQHLHNILESTKTEATPATVSRFETSSDNASGAIARILLKSPTLSLDNLSLVFIDSLPLRRDFAESEKVVLALYQLFQANDPAVHARLDHLLSIFKTMLDSTKDGLFPDSPQAQINEATRAKIFEILNVVNGAEPAKISALGLNQYL